MKAPLSWLKDYVDIDVAPEVLIEKLFSCGLEVEEVINVGKNIENIVVCKILDISKHPNADKLNVCQIDAGGYGKLQIITSAKNISAGDLVPVALDGACLNNGERIYNGELRGLSSFGMFCSGEELGITDDFYDGASVNGILILKEDYPLGIEVKTALGIEDVVLDINVTANRPDCQSIFGIAREVAAVLGKPLKMPALNYKTDKNLKTTERIRIENLATDLCPRYIGHYVSNVKIGPSPKWITKRLASVGIRSINNIVDITNFVLTELGQPMHAFDYNNIGGKTIVIRRANDGENIVTLDRKSFDLTSKNLVICDINKPIALAGIMGGLNSEIEAGTTEIVLESAKFLRDNIRKSSRSLGQRSDSSARYEKGVDAYTTGIAIDRALHLICELGCGIVASDRYDLPEYKEEPKVIKTTFSRIDGVLGIQVPKDETVNILTKLGFKCNADGDNLTVTVPLYREDMESYQDIAEEVIREYGYDNITPTLMTGAEITSGGLNDAQKDIENVKNYFTESGFNEIITYSFVSEKEFDAFAFDKKGMVKILNPLGEDLGVMRVSLVPSMVATVAKNLNRKNNEAKFFEFASIYRDNGAELPEQPKRLCFSAYGEKENFFTVKGVVEGLIETFAYEAYVDYERSKLPYLHPTLSADILIGGKTIGSFGALHPDIAEKYDIDKRVFVGEIDYGAFSENFNKKIYYKAISKFPTVERDLAVTVDKSVLCGRLISVIKAAAGEYLTSVKLFDVYEGDQIAEGKKSMAFNLLYSSLEKTLTVEEIDMSVAAVLKALREGFGAELR